MKRKVIKDKLWKTDRDKQIEEAVKLSKLPIGVLKKIKSNKSTSNTLPYSSIQESLRIGEEK
jgi:hypothetical protein